MHMLRAMVRAAAKTLPRPHAHLDEGFSYRDPRAILAENRLGHSQRR